MECAENGKASNNEKETVAERNYGADKEQMSKWWRKNVGEVDRLVYDVYQPITKLQENNSKSWRIIFFLNSSR